MRRNISIVLFGAALFLYSTFAWGQIALPELTSVGKIATVQCTVPVPDGERVKCRWFCRDAAVDLAPFDGGMKVHAVATKAGQYKIELITVVIND